MSDIPKGFWNLCLNLGQDSDVVYGPTLEVMMAGALNDVPTSQRAALRDYVDRILQANYSEAELLHIWLSSNSDLYPHKGFVHAWFSLIRATLDAGCVPYYGPLD